MKFAFRWFAVKNILFCFVIGGNSRSKLVNFGTKPDKKKLADWKDSKDFNPIPIKAEFTPIVNLFSTTNLDEKHNISSTAILQWFLPLYLKYCKVRKFLQILGLQPRISKVFSQSVEQFFLTVGQNNFGNKIPCFNTGENQNSPSEIIPLTPCE